MLTTTQMTLVVLLCIFVVCRLSASKQVPGFRLKRLRVSCRCYNSLYRSYDEGFGVSDRGIGFSLRGMYLRLKVRVLEHP